MTARSIILTLFSAATLLAAIPTTFAQSTRSQAGGLPALTEEVASLRATVEALQAQIGNNTNPFSGTFTVTVMETGIFACGATNAPPPGPLQPYLNTQGISSITTRSGIFNATANGVTMVIPEFQLIEQELRLSGNYETVTENAGGVEVVIGGNGSLYADLGEHGVLTGQISRDGSMFSALVHGSSVQGICDDVFTVLLTGVRK